MADLVIYVDAERIGTHYCNQNDELLGKLLPLVDKYRDGALSEQEQETIREAFDLISENDIEYYHGNSISGVEVHAGQSVKSLSRYWLNKTESTVEHEDGEYCIVSYFKWPGQTLTAEGFTSKAFVESKLVFDYLRVPFASKNEFCDFFNTIKYDGKEVEYNTDARKSDTYQLKIYKRSADNKFVEVVNFDFLNLSGCATLEVEGTEIGPGAYKKRGFVRVAIPEGVTKLESCAFERCVSLKSVTIPASMTKIEGYVFDHCTALESIAIPEGVTYIKDNAFNGCTSLTCITVAEGNKVYDSREGCNAIIETASNELVVGCPNTVIPESVTSIGSAFGGCTPLTTITIPDGVTSIMGSFSYCTALENITIPESVTEIGSHTFIGCTALASIALPEGLTKLGVCAFERCSSLTSITIPGVECIESSAFRECVSLKSVTILQGVKKIELDAFKDCTALETITLPAGIAKIDKSAFDGCTALKTIYVPAKKADYYLKRLPEALHALIVEQEPVKNAKKK